MFHSIIINVLNIYIYNKTRYDMISVIKSVIALIKRTKSDKKNIFASYTSKIVE